jgi:hypothetical protein
MLIAYVVIFFMFWCNVFTLCNIPISLCALQKKHFEIIQWIPQLLKHFVNLASIFISCLWCLPFCFYLMCSLSMTSIFQITIVFVTTRTYVLLISFVLLFSQNFHIYIYIYIYIGIIKRVFPWRLTISFLWQNVSRLWEHITMFNFCFLNPSANV